MVDRPAWMLPATPRSTSPCSSCQVCLIKNGSPPISESMALPCAPAAIPSASMSTSVNHVPSLAADGARRCSLASSSRFRPWICSLQKLCSGSAAIRELESGPQLRQRRLQTLPSSTTNQSGARSSR